MENDFVKIDLHIHTPASSCYKGEKDDNEYLKILRKAKSQNLKIISLTDHNSIEGYKSILKIKERLITEKDSLSSITDSEQANVRLKQVDSDLEIFDNILILPGVEFEVSNGIHLLVIFSIHTPVDQISSFLKEGGYTPENYGVEEPTLISNWDIFTLFEKSKNYDCIVIDAHTDSNKGILNTIPQGKTRANCFRSPQLSAVCYKSEEQKVKLQHILTTSKDYYRSITLAFLKFSDAHISDDVGLISTWIKLEDLSFESLKNALTNPSELISTEEPSVTKILDDLIKLPNSFGIIDITKESKAYIMKYISALSNSESGYILLGVTDKKVKVGIPVENLGNKDSLKPILDELIDCFRSVEPSFEMSVNLYELQNNRVIFSFHIRKSSSIVYIRENGNAYSLKENSLSLLRPSDIEFMVENRVLSDIQSRVEKRMQSVENDCQLIKNMFTSLPIIRFFDKNSRKARFKPTIDNCISLPSEDIVKLKKSVYNGRSRGNLFYYREKHSPRLPDAYLRYSLPLFTSRNIKSSSIFHETVYIVPGGGVFYSNRNYPFFSEYHTQIIKLHKRSIISGYNLKFIACFIKSSFLIWYLINVYDDVDIFSPDIFNNVRLPIINIKNPTTIDLVDTINSCFDKILEHEHNFLVGLRKINSTEIPEYAVEHNKKIDPLAYKIDRSIYDLIGLSAEEISTIEDSLRLNKIYIPEY